MPFDPIAFLLAIAGLLIGAFGVWYLRRSLLGPRIVLPPSVAGDPVNGAQGKEALVEAPAREQTSKQAE